MIKSRLFLLTLLGFNLSVVAQNLNINKIFPPAPVPKLENPFSGIRNGDMLVEDFNGDNIPDIIMMWGNNDYVNRTTMYIGTGGGAYTEFNGSNLPVWTASSYAVADVDGDGDLDVAVCGRTPSFGYETSLHYSNGSGVFSKAQIVPFINVSDGAVAFADVDGDQDLMVAGSNGLNGDSELYLNTGLGTFIASTTNSFPIMDDGDLDFADVDGDNDQDLIIVGRSNMGNLYLAQLFINDGSGSFSLSTGNSFTGANDSESHFFDADADGDMDLVISGSAIGNVGLTKLYMNDGLGNFSPGPDSNFWSID